MEEMDETDAIVEGLGPNFILCGDADYHCILCKETLADINEVDRHIRWEPHRRLIKKQVFLAKFKGKTIYKVDDGYYCAKCNFLASVVPEITAHNETHPTSKEALRVVPNKAVTKHVSGCVIFNNIVISKNKWQGIINKHCTLCDVDVEDIDVHIVVASHVIKLAQSRFIYETYEKYYRKISDGKYLCFLCKLIMNNETYLNHWTSEDHTKNVQKWCHNLILDNFIASGDLQNKSGYCKYCNELVNFKNFTTILKHKILHLDENNLDNDSFDSVESTHSECSVFDHGKFRHELSVFGKGNHIKMTPGGAKGFCVLCRVYMSASKVVFKQHIEGKFHQGLMEVQGLAINKFKHKKPMSKAVRLKDYIKSITYFDLIKHFKINDEAFIDGHSFMLVAPVVDNKTYLKTKCHLCDIEYKTGEDKQHYETDEHKKRFMAIKVLKLPTREPELIREIRPNLYHCGYCNEVLGFWDNVEKHLFYQKHSFKRGRKNAFAESISAVCTKQNFKEDIDVYKYILTCGIF